MNTTTMQQNKTRDIVFIGIFAALIAICSWISIPTTVPFTLQTMGVFTAVGLLGGKRGSLAVLVYILLGLVGLPVFAGFSGGFSSITSPTFGFVIGLALSAPLISALFCALKKRWKLFPAALVAGLAGILVTYLCGAVYGYFVMTLVLTKEVTLWFILWNWCLIYLPFDAAKLLAAAAITPALFKRIPGLR